MIYRAVPISFWKYEYRVFEENRKIGIIKHFYLKTDYFYLTGKEKEKYYLKGYRRYFMKTPSGEIIETEVGRGWRPKLSFGYEGILYRLEKRRFKMNEYRIYQHDTEIGLIKNLF